MTATIEQVDVRRQLNVSSLDNTLANFKHVSGAGAAYQVVKELADGGKVIVVVYGARGCGKTHLCDALSLAWWQQGILCRVIRWPDMADLLRRLTFSREDGEPHPNTVISNLSRGQRLIIDDYGMGGSDWKMPAEWIEKIIDWRYHEDLPTLLTTNLNIDDLPDRVASRFKDKVKARAVHNSAPDYRPKKVAK